MVLRPEKNRCLILNPGQKILVPSSIHTRVALNLLTRSLWIAPETQDVPLRQTKRGHRTIDYP